MRLIIAGGRDLFGEPVQDAIRRLAPSGVTVVLSGCARGVDREGELWARGMLIPVEHYVADWGQHGRAGGPIRNQRMVGDADALLLVWDGRSGGSADVRRRALAKGLTLYEAIIPRSTD